MKIGIAGRLVLAVAEYVWPVRLQAHREWVLAREQGPDLASDGLLLSVRSVRGATAAAGGTIRGWWSS